MPGLHPKPLACRVAVTAGGLEATFYTSQTDRKAQLSEILEELAMDTSAIAERNGIRLVDSYDEFAIVLHLKGLAKVADVFGTAMQTQAETLPKSAKASKTNSLTSDFL